MDAISPRGQSHFLHFNLDSHTLGRHANAETSERGAYILRDLAGTRRCKTFNFGGHNVQTEKENEHANFHARGRLCSSDCLKKSLADSHIVTLVRAREVSPALTRGLTEGNLTPVDKKSWLEVCDAKHRYGANLRAYYAEWKRLGQPGTSFWSWLDKESVEVDGVPRAILEKERVLYCEDPAERMRFAIDIKEGRLYSRATGDSISSGEEGWIFVLQNGVLYGHRKRTESYPRIHHTTFVNGECVQAAGIMMVEKGQIQKLFPHSGHYRPAERQMKKCLEFLEEHGVRLNLIDVDVQRLIRVARVVGPEGFKTKKMNSCIFWPGDKVLHFLSVKGKTWQQCVFCDLVQEAQQRLRRMMNSRRTKKSNGLSQRRTQRC